MKIKYIIFLAAVLAGLCVFGTDEASAQKKSKKPATVNSIVPQTNPLVIALDTFEGQQLGGERNFIGIADNKVQGKICYVNGMVRTGRLSGRDALIFKNCDAEIGEPYVNKKGTFYSFDVHVKDALFFNANPNTDWHLSITVYNDGKVVVTVDSDSITRIYSGSWVFMGHLDTERTLALKKLVETNQ